VDESTGTHDKAAAEAIRIKREAQLLDRSIFGAAATATFLEAAVGYLSNGGESRFLGHFDQKTKKWTGLIGHFKTTPLSSIDQAAIDHAARVLYPGRKTSTINRQVHTPVSAVIAWAVKRKLAQPLILERPKQPASRIRWLKPDEAERLIQSGAPHLQPVLIFLFATGARISEALGLDWHNVDLTARRVIFPKTKNGEPRGISLHDRAWLALANLPHRDGLVFRRADGEPYTAFDKGRRKITRPFQTACARAGIDDFTPHDCRHTWATWHYQTHRDLLGLKLAGGWKTLSQVEVYAHVNTDGQADQLNTLPLADLPQPPQAKPNLGKIRGPQPPKRATS
jgi:integrase